MWARGDFSADGIIDGVSSISIDGTAVDTNNTAAELLISFTQESEAADFLNDSWEINTAVSSNPLISSGAALNASSLHAFPTAVNTDYRGFERSGSWPVGAY